MLFIDYSLKRWRRQDFLGRTGLRDENAGSPCVRGSTQRNHEVDRSEWRRLARENSFFSF